MYLFQNQTTNGDSEIFSLSNKDGEGIDGEYFINIIGGWDGCTVTAHYSLDGTNWSAVDTDATFTQNKGIWVNIVTRSYIKLTLADAGASTNITSEIK